MGEACSRMPMPAVTLHEEHDPEEPELRGAPGVVDVDVVGGDERGLLVVASPACGLPTFAGTRMVKTPNIMKMK